MAKKKTSPKAKKADKPEEPKAPDAFERIEYKYDFNDAERADIGKKLAQLIREKDSIVTQAKASAKQWKLRIEECENKITALSDKTTDGFEMRPVEARVVFNRRKGMKTYYHPDTGAEIRTAEMSNADYEALPGIVPEPRKEPEQGEGLVNVGEALDKAAPGEPSEIDVQDD